MPGFNSNNGENTRTNVPLTGDEVSSIEWYRKLRGRDEDIATAVSTITETLVGKNENYVGDQDAEATAFDNFETVALIKEALYRGMPAEVYLTPQAAVLDQVIHKIVRLVRGSDWNEQVGEGSPDAARDLHGYAALLHALFVRRAREEAEASSLGIDGFLATLRRVFGVPEDEALQPKVNAAIRENLVLGRWAGGNDEPEYERGDTVFGPAPLYHTAEFLGIHTAGVPHSQNEQAVADAAHSRGYGVVVHPSNATVSGREYSLVKA